MTIKEINKYIEDTRRDNLMLKFNLENSGMNDPRTMNQIKDCSGTVDFLQTIKPYFTLLEKHNIPNAEYLEKCIIAHDIIGELEEQIGCPVEVLIKALKNGIYTQLGLTDKIVHYDVITDGEYLFATPLDIFDNRWLLKDYGKTWGLNKGTIGGKKYDLS